MRKFNTSDVFKLARILKTSNIKEQIGTIIENSKQVDKKDDKAVENLGIDIAFKLIECCSGEATEQELYRLLGGVLEIKPKQVELMEVNDLIENVKLIIKENDITSFFNTAGRLNL